MAEPGHLELFELHDQHYPFRSQSIEIAVKLLKLSQLLRLPYFQRKAWGGEAFAILHGRYSSSLLRHTEESFFKGWADRC